VKNQFKYFLKLLTKRLHRKSTKLASQNLREMEDEMRNAIINILLTVHLPMNI